MSLRSAGAFFTKLIPSIISDLRRIARRSLGETTVEDLQAEAWILAEELSLDRDPPPDLCDRTFQQQILGRLYNRFVKFSDKHFRFSIRLDESREDDEGSTTTNPVLAFLKAPSQSEPMEAVELREEEDWREREIRSRYSEAVAYVRVFEVMKHEPKAVAEHLAIAVTTLHRRVGRARLVVERQRSLFDGVTEIPVDFLPPRSLRTIGPRRSGCASASTAPMQSRLFPTAYIPLRPIR